MVEFAARLSLGGPALGIVIGLLGSFVMGFIINDVVTEVSLTLLLSYGSFALAESTDLKVGSIYWYLCFALVLYLLCLPCLVGGDWRGAGTVALALI